jgi:UDPglucose 6-dehydrogenase
MKIAVIGAGYQGLVVGTCLADSGHTVICVDRDPARIDTLRKGKSPIYEPGLEELIVRNLEEERIAFTTDLADAVRRSVMVFLCVGTSTREDGGTDTTEVFAALEQVARAMDGYRIIVNKCTCPPGTAEEMEKFLRAHTSYTADVVVNPDFMKEGAAVDDFLRPDRVIVGCEEVRVREIMKELYTPFLRTGRPLLFMSLRSAEMTKYATNAMLAARISLMNQLAELCSAYGADINEVREGVAADERIGPKFLFPGIGFGGSGLPRDLNACIRMAKDKGLAHDLLEAIKNVNERRREEFLRLIYHHYGDNLSGKRLAVWGVSFKPRTDDLRGAPAVFVLERLIAAGVQVVAYDPAAGQRLKTHFGDAIQIVTKSYQALEGADGLIIFTEWNEFRRPDYERMAQLMRERVVFDGRNLYTPRILEEHGFRYYCIGRPTAVTK